MNPVIFEYEYDSSASSLMSELLGHGLAIPKSLQSAVDKRKIDFLAGRYCANQALSELLGQTHQETLKIGKNKSPIWPHSIMGSITHTKGFAAAVVALESQFRGLGIDAERYIENPNASLIKHICSEGEFGRLESSCDLDQQSLLTLVFSAKESLFKTLNPIVGVFFGFQAASVQEIDQDQQRLKICLTEDVGCFEKGFEMPIEYYLRPSLCLTISKLGWD